MEISNKIVLLVLSCYQQLSNRRYCSLNIIINESTGVLVIKNDIIGPIISNSIKSFQVNEKCLLDNQIEQVWCSIEIGLENILSGCIYRTGVSDISNCEKITKSIRYAYDAWQKGKYSGIIICGDLNFSNINWFSDGSCKLAVESDLIGSHPSQ